MTTSWTPNDPMDDHSRRCTARSKRSGDRCRRIAATGRTVCAMHGGKSPAGIAAAAFRNGRHSKYVPVHLLARYQAAGSDSEILALHDEIALIDTRLFDVLSRVESGESGRVWDDLRAAHQSLRSAMREATRTGNMRPVAHWLQEIETLIERGHGDAAAWTEVFELVERRRRVVESERKRQVSMQQMISAAEAMALVAALTEAVRAHVHDPETLRAISEALVRLVGPSLDGRSAHL